MSFEIGRFFRRRRPPPPVVAEQHEIYLSSNCQSGGMIAALRCFLPERDIEILRFPKADDREQVERFRSALRTARIWITTQSLPSCSDVPVDLIQIPDINFTAFHPDLRAAVNASTGAVTEPINNSQIVVWAYNNGLSETETARLFNRRVFAALGYLDCWASCVADLKTRFANATISAAEFERFFLRVQRLGQFMYTSNHPRIEALVELARIVARRLGADARRIEGDIVLPDALTFALWPVYPEIGEELGLRGGYLWRFANQERTFELDGLDAYIRFAFHSFASRGLPPGAVTCPRQLPQLDATLRDEVGRP